MKFTLLLSLLALFSNNIFSQPKKGNLLLGGGFSYSNMEEEASSLFDDKLTIFRFNPSFNFYIGKDVTLGLNFTYQNSINTSIETDPTTSQQSRFKSTIKTYNIGPILSFQPNITKHLFFKGDIGINFGFGNGDYRNGGNKYESSISSFSFRVTPGLIYFISKSIAIAGSFGGIYYENLEEEVQFPTSNSFGNTEEKAIRNNLGFDFNASSFNLSLFFLISSKTVNEDYSIE